MTSNHSETVSLSGAALDLSRLPVRVTVVAVGSARYSSAADHAVVKESQWFVPLLKRPLNWDDRRAGIDVVTIQDGREIPLASSGMQSVPQPGWVLLLTSGDSKVGFSWTLYGIKSK